MKKIYSGIQGDYVIMYCTLCESDIIKCLDLNCHGSSCNGGGCSKCHQDFENFNELLRQNKE